MSKIDKTNRINQFKDSYQNSWEGYTLFKNPSGSLLKFFNAHNIEITAPENWNEINRNTINQDIWAQAAQLVFDLYEYHGYEADKGFIQEMISEKTTKLNITNPLWYLTDETEKGISEFMGVSNRSNIKEACMFWVQNEVEKTSNILNEWVYQQD